MPKNVVPKGSEGAAVCLGKYLRANKIIPLNIFEFTRCYISIISRKYVNYLGKTPKGRAHKVAGFEKCLPGGWAPSFPIQTESSRGLLHAASWILMVKTLGKVGAGPHCKSSQAPPCSSVVATSAYSQSTHKSLREC